MGSEQPTGNRTPSSGGNRWDHDFVIIGSGFGGSAAALRLAEKGYRVLVLEKGLWKSAADFPRTNWNLKKWLWLPSLHFSGFFQLSFFRHITALTGVGVGGGSLVYANTLPVPDSPFFQAPSWAHLADWQNELAPFYDRARRMMGTVANPHLAAGDLALKTLARQLGRKGHFRPTDVAVYFGAPEVEVPDPYFGGQGPPRSGCNFCGACMTGCRYNAKNSLDKNYLYLARRRGARIQARAEVVDVAPIGRPDGVDGYRITWRRSLSGKKKESRVTCRGVVFSGGVLGTVELLLKLKKSSLPALSDRVGADIRTNSECLIGVVTPRSKVDFSEGVAIGSILNTDAHTHLEPVRYGSGSGFWRTLMVPMASGQTTAQRLRAILSDLTRRPTRNLRAFMVKNFAERTQILLFMQAIDSRLKLSLGRLGLSSRLQSGSAPTPFIPEALDLARRYAAIVDGTPMVLLTETLAGIPTTAHMLGGAVMGENADEGVIDAQNRVFGYRNMYVCDGSMISANPGVNPSLTILALSERAMSRIPPSGKPPEAEVTRRPPAASVPRERTGVKRAVPRAEKTP